MTTSLASQHRCGPARETAVVQIPCCYFANAASHSQGVPATRTAFWSCTRARAHLQRGQEMETYVACVCVRAAFGCAAELWRNLLPSTVAIRIRFAALRVSRCGHRLYKTMFGFPSGACYVCGELGVAKCRASRSSEHSCKEKCSRSLCFCCSYSFAFLCALGS